MNIADFEKMKKAERHARVSGPLMELVNERWGASDKKDPAFIEALNRIQAVSQELLDLITAGLL
jgi:glycerate kinase